MIKLTRRYRSFKDLRSDPNGFLLLIFEGGGFRNKKDLFVSFSDFIICLERVIKDSESINKRYLYRFFDHLFKEGSYEIFENREALGILELICKFHYGAEGILSLYSIDPQKLSEEANAFLTANAPRVKEE